MPIAELFNQDNERSSSELVFAKIHSIPPNYVAAKKRKQKDRSAGAKRSLSKARYKNIDGLF
jgi:hypothetical protein